MARFNLNAMNLSQKILKSYATKALDKAKNIERKTHFAKKGESGEVVKFKGYKRKTIRFPIEDYAYEIAKVDTKKAFVSINGRTGFVTVKLLDK